MTGTLKDPTTLGAPVIRSLVKVATEPPTWRVVFEGDPRPVVLTTATILNFRALRCVAFARHGFIFDRVRNERWIETLRAAARDLLTVETPPEAPRVAAKPPRPKKRTRVAARPSETPESGRNVITWRSPRKPPRRATNDTRISAEVIRLKPRAPR